ncbi:MAG TPA: methylmalonyl Co-A mutase-associated GTPase MeaB [Acidimicrobiales bacterium]|jgi:LAO/AO transport system kinase|nr:methylmalonyl Co-A mutase-associated GTPase MeaB [Acidimicrobiales bacterium]
MPSPVTPSPDRKDPATLFAAAQAGDRVALARLLSLIERGGAPSRVIASLAYQTQLDSYTVGITGAPGAGKSTLTDQLIAIARGSGQVGVLAIDPSSPFSGGAILGDRVRMQNHALDESVFIRSMATRGHLGGLAVAVPDAVRVLSAAGFSMVFIETVGVGQQEVSVASAADTTMVVVNPGWGDAIQANKAGLMEIADLFVINKADRPGARETRRDLEQMLDLTALDGWRPPILETVASTGDGCQELWDSIGAHRADLEARGLLEARRRQRLEREFHQIVAARVEQRIHSPQFAALLGEVTDALAGGKIDPYEAADRMLSAIADDDDDQADDGATA